MSGYFIMSGSMSQNGFSILNGLNNYNRCTKKNGFKKSSWKKSIFSNLSGSSRPRRARGRGRVV